jgi:hypothetical protein
MVGNAADVLLRVTKAEDERAATPAAPPKSRYHGLAGRTVTSLPGTISAVCSDIRTITHSFVRLQHPDDAVAPPIVFDQITQILDEIGKADRNTTAVVVVGADRWSLVRHVQAIITLYYVVEGELQHLKRLVNAADAASGAPQQTFARDVRNDVNRRRKARDERRDRLVRAHATAVNETRDANRAEGQTVGAPMDAATLLDKRTTIKQQRNQRRRRDDVKRSEIETAQMENAARKINRLARTFLGARREAQRDEYLLNRRRGGGGGAVAGSGLAGAASSPSTARGIGQLTPQEVLERRERLAAKYREGDYPLIGRLVDSLMESFGVEFITNHPPAMATSKAFRQWSVRFRRVDPVDDLDVSSEEEEWSCGVVERVRQHVPTAFCPLHDAQLAMKLAGSADLSYMLDIFANYAGLASLQRKGMIAIERLGAMIQYAAFLSLHHKRALASEYANQQLPPLLQQLIRLPAKQQNSPAWSFMTMLRNHGAGQALLNHGCWLTTFLVAQPKLLHPPCSTRLLTAAPTPTGAFIPANPEGTDGATGLARASLPDMLQQVSPKTQLFLAPDHLTIDQWADTVAAALKKANGARRVLWLSMRPELTTYINDVPFFVTARPELIGHDDSLQSYTCMHTANLNGARPPVDMLRQPPLLVPGPAEAYLALQRPVLPVAGSQQQQHQSAAATGTLKDARTSEPVSRRGSLSRGATRIIDTRDMQLRSPTPGADDVTTTSSHVANQRPPRSGGKEVPLPTGWLGLNWDALERELCAELIDTLDTSEDGRLKVFVSNAVVAGPGVPVAANSTLLSDRPSQPPPPPLLGLAAARAHQTAESTTDAAADSVPPPLAQSQKMTLPLSTAPMFVVPPASLPSTTPKGGLGAPMSLFAAPGAMPNSAITPQISPRRIPGEPPARIVSGTLLLPESAAAFAKAISAISNTASEMAFENPPRTDGDVIVTAQAMQLIRPRGGGHGTKDSKRRDDAAASNAPSANGSPNPRWGTASNVEDSPADQTISPVRQVTAAGGLGHTESFVDTASDTGSHLHSNRGTAIGRSGAASKAVDPSHRKTVRGLQSLRNRQPSAASAISEGQPAEEDESITRLPYRASDACLTPWQAADEVRLRLKRRFSLDNAITYRRAPFMRTTGDVWLKGVDQLYHLAHEQLADPFLAVVFGVSDSDSIFAALICTIVWAVEHGKDAMLGVPESRSHEGWDSNAGSAIFDAGVFATAGSRTNAQQAMEFTIGRAMRLLQRSRPSAWSTGLWKNTRGPRCTRASSSSTCCCSRPTCATRSSRRSSTTWPRRRPSPHVLPGNPPRLHCRSASYCCGSRARRRRHSSGTCCLCCSTTSFASCRSSGR